MCLKAVCTSRHSGPSQSQCLFGWLREGRVDGDVRADTVTTSPPVSLSRASALFFIVVTKYQRKKEKVDLVSGVCGHLALLLVCPWVVGRNIMLEIRAEESFHSRVQRASGLGMAKDSLCSTSFWGQSVV